MTRMISGVLDINGLSDDVFRRPPIASTGWRWWLDDAGRRNAAFYVSRWLIMTPGAGDCARLFGLRMRYGCAAVWGCGR